jgi:hypothetical protein
VRVRNVDPLLAWGMNPGFVTHDDRTVDIANCADPTVCMVTGDMDPLLTRGMNSGFVL